MAEILALQESLQQGDIQASLAIVEELEEISKQDIIDTITSSAVVFLLNLVKQQAKNRTTRSWEVSIRNAAREKNKRRQAGGYYLTRYLRSWRKALTDNYITGLCIYLTDGYGEFPPEPG